MDLAINTPSNINTIKQFINQLNSRHIDPLLINDIALLQQNLRTLLLFILNKPLNFLISNNDYELTELEQQQFTTGAMQLINGFPLEYITQTAYFYGRAFFVNDTVLIPRPDSELLVQQALATVYLLPSNTPLNLLELGTGSGCLAISIYLELVQTGRTFTLTASDKMTNALTIAQKNAKTHKANIAFVQSDWFLHIPKMRYAIIFANPPYISKNDTHLLHLAHEPITALTAAQDGLADLVNIIQNARAYLQNGGYLLLEHGYNQGDSVQKLLIENGYCNCQLHYDLGGRARVSMGQFWLT